MSVPAEAGRLYGLALAEFVPERTALAKALRADGRRDEAAAVAKLAKPTVAAWAANQVLRTQAADRRELLAAGDALTEATGPGLREAIARHRDALGRLMAAARGLLDPDGRELSAGTLEKVMQTLNAASLDPELREAAEHGRLAREQVFSGLGLRTGPREGETQPEPARKAKPKPKPKPKPQPKPKPKRNVKLEAAERRLAAAEERVEQLRAEVARLREE